MQPNISAIRLLSLLPLTSKQAENDPDCDRNSCEIIHSRGYICEEHYVETSDGWILGLHVCSLKS